MLFRSKRGIGEFAVKEEPVARKPAQIQPKKAKIAPRRQPIAPREQPRQGVSLPHYARVWQNTPVFASITAEIDAILDDYHKNPFIYPVLPERTVTRVVEQQRSATVVRRKRRRKAEMLLLLAA